LKTNKEEVKTLVFTSRGGVMHDKVPVDVQQLCPARQSHSLTFVLRRAIRQETHNQGLVFVVFLALEAGGVNG
jgi:hypothetical protein